MIELANTVCLIAAAAFVGAATFEIALGEMKQAALSLIIASSMVILAVL